MLFDRTPLSRTRISARGAATAVLAACLFVAGCAGTRERCPALSAVRYSAAEDSLSLAAFSGLPPAMQAARRADAAVWRQRAGDAASVGAQAQALLNATGLAPDDGDAWLRLAEIWRWYGDYLAALACLDAAAATVRERQMYGETAAEPEVRREVTLRTCLLRAWLHYDRAEWQTGADWADAALRLEGGNAAALEVKALLRAAQGYQSSARAIADDLQRLGTHQADVRWIRAIIEQGLGREREAFGSVLGLRADKPRAAECYRDMGAIAERVGEWTLARQWYSESAAALPLGDGSCLTRMVHPRLETGAGAAKQPFWLAFDRYYVTGSLSAYTAFALGRFDLAGTSAARAEWAGAVVNAAGIHLRRNPGSPWALRARGLVFARTGKEDLALPDLRRAVTWLERHGVADARVEAELGHLLLRRDEPRAALDHLRRALALDDEAAGAWADVGVALVKLGDRGAAREALDRAIALDAENATAWYNRGLLHLHDGRRAAAAEDLEQAARLAPNDQDVARLLQQLRRELEPDAPESAAEEGP